MQWTGLINRKITTCYFKRLKSLSWVEGKGCIKNCAIILLIQDKYKYFPFLLWPSRYCTVYLVMIIRKYKTILDLGYKHCNLWKLFFLRSQHLFMNFFCILKLFWRTYEISYPYWLWKEILQDIILVKKIQFCIPS